MMPTKNPENKSTINGVPPLDALRTPPAAYIPHLHIPRGRIDEALARDDEGIEKVREGAPYFVIGCPPNDTRLKDHSNVPQDLALWVKALMGGEDETIALVVADAGLALNIHDAEIKRGETETPNLKEVCERRARIIGQVQVLFIQAMEDWAIDATPEDSTLKRRPVFLLSDVLKNDSEFQKLHKTVENLVRENPPLAKRMLRCLPSRIIQREMGMARKEIRITGDKTPEKIISLLKYVILQTAVTLSKGTKLGHENEKAYDSVARHMAGKYGDALQLKQEPEFIYPEVETPGTTKCPYRAYPFGEGSEHPLPLVSLDRHASTFASISEMAQHFDEFLIPLYLGFLERLQHSKKLNPKEKTDIIQGEGIKMVREMVVHLTREAPAFAYLFKHSGILEALNQLQKGDRDVKSTLESSVLPINYGQKRGESPEAVVTRHFCRLIQGIRGPVSMESFASITNTLGDQFWGIATNVYESMTGRPIAKRMDFYENTWEIEYDNFFREILGTSSTDLTSEEHWQALDTLTGLLPTETIRGLINNFFQASPSGIIKLEDEDQEILRNFIEVYQFYLNHNFVNYCRRLINPLS
ncbi:MAG: hypothetical protein Q8P27_02100 [Candidatus Peregrinibacteria bacterium]|nr:hypothetical protein [Candidatus Peregrinibacteria bacterium]